MNADRSCTTPDEVAQKSRGNPLVDRGTITSGDGPAAARELRLIPTFTCSFFDCHPRIEQRKLPIASWNDFEGGKASHGGDEGEGRDAQG
ncbi:uncharacterized protein CDV56_107784 [Aspergillus thermomutatus]|uniref:Uncharacterized protein n=1 Tax=Aspergillus thermomutatus TaxID=41047 RepID=A0A397HKX7_ASPTH|nr:uncharacterized protein CDV56_107784 [Aspergillus thermomutatus]RHZ62014.1 hypothetical protein CDV56_107784 [Aspergillus thermomutatus]